MCEYDVGGASIRDEWVLSCDELPIHIVELRPVA
jgi:hypothetical protein